MSSNRVTVERLRGVLRQRGLRIDEKCNVSQTLTLMSDEQHRALSVHLGQILAASDDAVSMAWVKTVLRLSTATDQSVRSMPVEFDDLAELRETIANAQARKKPGEAVPGSGQSNSPTASGAGHTPGTLRTQDERKHKNHHVYAKGGALSIELDRLNGAFLATGDACLTLTIDAAKATGVRQFGWDQKITVQLSATELPLFLSVFLGGLKTWACSNHGVSNDKRMLVERKPATHNLLIHVVQGKSSVACPVGAGDAYHVMALGMEALRHNHPHLDSVAILELVRAAALLENGQ